MAADDGPQPPGVFLRWFRLKRPSGALIVSTIAFLSSQLSCFLSFRTHSLTQRPYVGIDSAIARLDPEDKCANPKLSWTITFKNVGPTSVRMRLREHRLMVREGEQVFVDLKPEPGHLVTMLPGGDNAIQGTFACDTVASPEADNCKAILCHVRHNMASAEVSVRFTYWGPGWLWGERAYRYETRFTYANPPHEGLTPVWTLAD